MIKTIQHIYYQIFKQYRRIEIRCVTWNEGDQLIKTSIGKPEHEQWVLATPEEDYNIIINQVWLERRERITK